MIKYAMALPVKNDMKTPTGPFDRRNSLSFGFAPKYADMLSISQQIQLSYSNNMSREQKADKTIPKKD